MKVKKILFSPIVIVSLATVALLFGVLRENGLLQGPELKIYDRMMRANSPVTASRVVVVGIDKRSVGAIGEWPWPRSVLAQAVEELSAAGAGAIGVHMLFAEKERNPGFQEMNALKAALDQEWEMGDIPAAESLAQWIDEAIVRLDHDTSLVSAVKSSRNMVLPFEFELENGDTYRAGDTGLSGLMLINSLRADRFPAADADSMRDKLWHYFKANHNTVEPHFLCIRETYRELAGKAGGLGHINLALGADGGIRAMPLLVSYRERFFPSFALQVFAKYSDTPLRHLSVNRTGSDSSVTLGGSVIPLEDNFNFRIRYRYPSELIHRVSMIDLLDQRIPPEVFQDKIVLIGLVAGPDMGPLRTPVHSSMNAVEVMAHAVDTLVEKDYLVRPFWTPLLEMAVLVYFGLMLIFVVPKMSLKLGGMILGLFLAAWIGGVLLLFRFMGVWLWLLPPVYLTLGGFCFTGIHMRMARLREEAAELNRSLGATYQSQGLLDMAFEKYKKCPVENKEIKEMLYELGMEYERKRMVSKAFAVYKHLRRAGRYQDLDRRLQNLHKNGTIILSNTGETPASTLALNDSAVLPTFGRYEIVKELGQGAMGTVYLGRDPKIKREVAIKTLAYNAVDSSEIKMVKSRFFHEAETAGKLSHPNIVTIYDIGEEHDMAYMAMELLNGEDLSTFCKKGALLPLNTVMDIMLKVAMALDYAHKNGVVHRDIKPANIMRLKTGEVKVTDFGIARVMDNSKTRTGIVLGTPSYMSPEQVAGKKVDGRSDLFSLGIVFYELLSGEKPFTGENLTAVMYAITKGKHRPLSQLVPHLAPECERIITRLMTKPLTRRYNAAEIVVREIEKCMAKLGISGN